LKTHFEEDVRFACGCDIEFAIWEFGAPRLFISFLSPTTLIDDERALTRHQNRR
jgi:hypothetical protein